MHEDLCPYTSYGLQFYIIFPLIQICHIIDLPIVPTYAIAFALPSILLKIFIKIIESIAHERSPLTFMNHSPSSITRHHHNVATTFGVITTSSILGLLFTIGLSFIVNGNQSHFQPLGIYMILLSFFHFSEFFTTSLTNPNTLNLSSFLLDQSVAYVLAICGSFIEFLVEAYFYPDSKTINYVSAFGLCLALIGELMRKTAMFTAGRNFTHTIALKRDPEHCLVTSGIYGIIRHPSYAGWFYWAVGTQILLKNPLCTIVFAAISHNFFKDRIEYEERILLRFFGKEYDDYRKRVGLWMPLIF